MSILNSKLVNWIMIMLTVVFAIAMFKFNQILALATAYFLSFSMIFLFHFIDDKALPQVDTYTELITNKNLAYAVYMLSLAVLIMGGFLSAVLIFFSLR